MAERNYLDNYSVYFVHRRIIGNLVMSRGVTSVTQEFGIKRFSFQSLPYNNSVRKVRSGKSYIQQYIRKNDSCLSARENKDNGSSICRHTNRLIRLIPVTGNIVQQLRMATGQCCSLYRLETFGGIFAHHPERWIPLTATHWQRQIGVRNTKLGYFINGVKPLLLMRVISLSTWCSPRMIWREVGTRLYSTITKRKRALLWSWLAYLGRQHVERMNWFQNFWRRYCYRKLVCQQIILPHISIPRANFTFFSILGRQSHISAPFFLQSRFVRFHTVLVPFIFSIVSFINWLNTILFLYSQFRVYHAFPCWITTQLSLLKLHRGMKYDLILMYKNFANETWTTSWMLATRPFDINTAYLRLWDKSTNHVNFVKLVCWMQEAFEITEQCNKCI